MDRLRVWLGGTDTTLPDFSTPVGGSVAVDQRGSSTQTSYFSSLSNGSSYSSWIPSFESNNSQQSEECLPSLSWMQRVIIFITLLLLGIVFCAFSTMVIVNPRSFGKYYTLGNIFIISSTFFLVGPRRQLSNMFDKSRFVAALVYFGSMAATLYSAIGLQSVFLTFVLVIIQLGSSVWYGSSYIPFAQQLIKSTAGTILPL